MRAIAFRHDWSALKLSKVKCPITFDTGHLAFDIYYSPNAFTRGGFFVSNNGTGLFGH